MQVMLEAGVRCEIFGCTHHVLSYVGTSRCTPNTTPTLPTNCTAGLLASKEHVKAHVEGFRYSMPYLALKLSRFLDSCVFGMFVPC